MNVLLYHAEPQFEILMEVDRVDRADESLKKTDTEKH